MKRSHLLRLTFALGLLFILISGSAGTSLYAATSTPTASSLELNQTYTTKTGFFSMSYPDGWIAQETQRNLISFAHDEALIKKVNSSPNPSLGIGELILQVQIIEPGNRNAERYDLSEGGKSLLKSLISSAGSSQSIKFSEINETKVGDLAAATVIYTFEQAEGHLYL
jgi:hypothetical protein